MQHETVKEYYGKVLKTTADLKTSACCSPEALALHIRALLANLHQDVTDKYYGCGLVAPSALEGCRILDLGSGSGRDAYLLAQLAGESGEIVGIDMTEEQLATAEAHLEWHRKKFGFKNSNVRFMHGYIETLHDLPLDPESFHVVVSNCVINLSLDKFAVLKGAYDCLKPGGELYFSDVYCDRRLDPSISRDPLLYGECLGGALYWNDLIALSKRAGFLDPRLVTCRPIDVADEAIRAKLGNAKFFSATYRLFKLDGLEPACEDYGQAVIYRGTVPGQADTFELDGHHIIERGKVFPVCGNTWRMLAETRYARHFDFIGDFRNHYGIFPGCGTSMPFEQKSTLSGGDCC